MRSCLSSREVHFPLDFLVPQKKILSHLEKFSFRPISASRGNEKFFHVTNMLHFLIFLFLELERKC